MCKKETIINNEPEIKMSRAERRDRIRYFGKMTLAHIKNEPKYDMSIDTPEEQQAQIFKINSWMARSGILLRKLEDLGYDTKKDKFGIYKTLEKNNEKRISSTSTTKIGDM